MSSHTVTASLALENFELFRLSFTEARAESQQPLLTMMNGNGRTVRGNGYVQRLIGVEAAQPLPRVAMMDRGERHKSGRRA